jgi:hypothetical protein
MIRQFSGMMKVKLVANAGFHLGGFCDRLSGSIKKKCKFFQFFTNFNQVFTKFNQVLTSFSQVFTKFNQV